MPTLQKPAQTMKCRMHVGGLSRRRGGGSAGVSRRLCMYLLYSTCGGGKGARQHPTQRRRDGIPSPAAPRDTREGGTDRGGRLDAAPQTSAAPPALNPYALRARTPSVGKLPPARSTSVCLSTRPTSQVMYGRRPAPLPLSSMWGAPPRRLTTAAA